MTQPVTLPLWLLILVLAFAAVTFASHFLFPSVRWFFRRRAERVVARLNERLQKPIEPFKLARRYDMIQRLIYDPEVAKAISEHARKEGIPENVAFEKAGRYAREIVPSFSATMYFAVGARIAKWMSRFLYRVRVGQFDRGSYAAIDADATIVFVMNHRSNMDYMLVTHLVSRTSAMSYAVGEWARVWPLSGIIRMMGAYFIRRKSRGALYRKVLARYVQMATQGGVTQAVFPEGGLSLTGALAPPRLGIMSYVVDAYTPDGRDVVFVPVALNYDQVLEDRMLIKANAAGVRKFRPPLLPAFGAVVGYLVRRLFRRAHKFGTATVSFGDPLSLRNFDIALGVEPLADDLMARIAKVVPLLPVPLVARAVLGGATSKAEVTARVADSYEALRGARVPLPRRPAETVAAEGIAILQRRNVFGPDALVPASTDAEAVLAYYANSIAHHFDAVAAKTPENAATAKQ